MQLRLCTSKNVRDWNPPFEKLQIEGNDRLIF
jgi:hypothetical protein